MNNSDHIVAQCSYNATSTSGIEPLVEVNYKDILSLFTGLTYCPQN